MIETYNWVVLLRNNAVLVSKMPCTSMALSLERHIRSVWISTLGPVSQKILGAIVIVNIYQEQKCASPKNHNIMITSVFERSYNLRCSRNYSLLAYSWHWRCLIQEDEDDSSRYRNLKIFVKRPPVYPFVACTLYATPRGAKEARRPGLEPVLIHCSTLPTSSSHDG